MMRVLFIARYRDDTMRRKAAHLARQPDIELRAIEPAHWQDELLDVDALSELPYSRSRLRMCGKASDPHRAFYRTLSFGLPRFQPHIIHAEEEPDSLAAAQIAVARALFAPHAKLILHTWQNIHRRRRAAAEAVMAFSLRAADAVLCANRGAQAILRQRRYHGRTAIIPAVGVDTDLFTPASPAAPHTGFVLGYFGRLAPEKDLATLFTALTHLPSEVTARIVGDGPQKAELLALATQLNLTHRIVLASPLPPRELVSEYGRLDAFVLPSRTTAVWKEQLGRVLLEAMACRIPVIGSDSGAIPEVVGDAGLIFAEGNAEALAACVRDLMHSDTRRQAVIERGYQRARAVYAQTQLALRTLDFYRLLWAP